MTAGVEQLRFNLVTHTILLSHASHKALPWSWLYLLEHLLSQLLYNLSIVNWYFYFPWQHPILDAALHSLRSTLILANI